MLSSAMFRAVGLVFFLFHIVPDRLVKWGVGSADLKFWSNLLYRKQNFMRLTIGLKLRTSFVVVLCGVWVGF